MMCKNQYGRPTSNLSNGRLERTKRMKQQRSTSRVLAKAPPMLLSVSCTKIQQVGNSV